MAGFVNTAGSIGEALITGIVFIPLFFTAKSRTARWTGYWGICVYLNIAFYWLVSPIVSTANRFDTIAFAGHIGTHPLWISLCSVIPFGAALYGIKNATVILRRDVIQDPGNSHLKTLVLIYALYFSISLLILLQITDRFLRVVG